MSDDEEHVFMVVATKTITATFEVYAEDEDDARFQVETPPHMTFEVTVSDAMKLEQDDWDVSTIEEKVTA